MSNGIIPVVAANATNPEPAGKEMPIGKRVCESPPVPTVSGSNITVKPACIIPSPGFKLIPPLLLIDSGSVL